MEILDNEQQQQLNPPIIRSRRNSLQPIDRHINDIDLNGSIYINAGIDSTCGIKQNMKTEILIDQNIDSSNASHLISIQNK